MVDINLVFWVKENNKKLESCEKRHNFSIEVPGGGINKKWKCKHCEGRVDSIAKFWYLKGVKDGENSLKQ